MGAVRMNSNKYLTKKISQCTINPVYQSRSCEATLFLVAPIHCRGSIRVMLWWFCFQNLFPWGIHTLDGLRVSTYLSTDTESLFLLKCSTEGINKKPIRYSASIPTGECIWLERFVNDKYVVTLPCSDLKWYLFSNGRALHYGSRCLERLKCVCQMETAL